MNIWETMKVVFETTELYNPENQNTIAMVYPWADSGLFTLGRLVIQAWRVN